MQEGMMRHTIRGFTCILMYSRPYRRVPVPTPSDTCTHMHTHACPLTPMHTHRLPLIPMHTHSIFYSGTASR